MSAPWALGLGRLLAPYSSPPRARSPEQDHPTLLVTYWCTGSCIAIILMRLAGRYIRVSALYRDDRFMAATILPLLLHQAFVHVVLLYGTNNVAIAAADPLPPGQLGRRRIGSGMVLGARITYAVYIWFQKFCITEFYVRLTEHFWERSYEIGLRIIRWGLLATLLGAVVSVFAECSPSHRLWQVTPDPGPLCRSGYAPLLTTASLSVLMDALLVLSPIAPILQSSYSALKKLRLIVTVFCLPLLCIAMAGYRVPTVLRAHGSQQLRSLLAAFDILLATVVSNAIIINSFARGRGTRRREPSGDRGIDDGEGGLVRNAYWGSDDDIARQVGAGRVPGIAPLQRGYGLAGEASSTTTTSSSTTSTAATATDFITTTTNPPTATAPTTAAAAAAAATMRKHIKDGWGPGPGAPITPPPPPPKQDTLYPTFFDVGGLLQLGGHRHHRHEGAAEDGDEGEEQDRHIRLELRPSISWSEMGLRDIAEERGRETRQR